MASTLSHIRHYSFDLWLTLIKSNPEFKKTRAAWFHKHYNTAGKSLAEVDDAFRQVDLMCNHINEKTGGNITSEEMYLMVLYRINNSAEVFAGIDMAALYNTLEQMFFNYIPLVYSAETAPCLDKIKQTGNSTIGLLSNTGYIKGATLRKALQELNLAAYFNFQMYSDEAVMSKPNPAFFAAMAATAAGYHTPQGLPLNQILHIGDNPLADIAGATQAGMQAFLINSNQLTISSLFN